jgi:hypothetical protein
VIRSGRRALRALLALAALGCGGAPPRGSATEGPALRYAMSVSPGLDTMTVEVCPGTLPLPRALVAIHDEAPRHLRAAAITMGGDEVARLPLGPRLPLDDAPTGACARYTISLADCGRSLSQADCARIGDDVFAPTSAWLFAPDVRQLAAHYALRASLPDGVSLTPAWPRVDEGYELDDRAFAFVTYLVIGAPARRTVPVPGACLDVATLDGRLDATEEARTRWLRTAAEASARVTGRAPFERATVLVVPTLDVPGMPVVFGVAGRGMRPTVTLFVSAHAREAELVPDWTAIHELSHLLTGYVDGEDVWLSEGLATYYEEVLRARAGLFDETHAWAALTSGFARGRAGASDRPLRDACRAMHVTHGYTHVYWAGAAIALLADVAYRREGSSLDEAVVRAAALRDRHPTGAELVRAMDGRDAGPFARVVARWLDDSAFPDVDDALAWLGVAPGVDGIRLIDGAPGAAARTSLMNAAPPLASNPSDCDDE